MTTTAKKQDIRSYHIQTLKKFPTITFEIAFLQVQKAEALEARNLVAQVLLQVLADFPTKIATKSYFADLYSARIYSHVQRQGDKHEVSFQFVFTDPQVVGDAQYQLSDLLRAIKRVLLEPALEDGMFLADVVALEKTLIQARIANMDDDKSTYAQLKLLEHMFADTPFALRPYGELARYEALTVADVYQTYQKMLAEDTLMISVVGDVDVPTIEHAFTDMFKSIQTVSVALPPIVTQTREKKDVQTFVETQTLNQTRLHIGYRMPATLQTPDYFVHRVASEILGGGAQSKLFQNVRERASLAYSIQAMMAPFAGALFIYAGVDHGKVDAAHAIIREQIQDMQQGVITAEEVTLAKSNLLHRLSMAQDRPLELIRLQKQLVAFPYVHTLSDWKQALQSVTIEDIIKETKTWEEDTVFILTDKTTKKENTHAEKMGNIRGN